MIAADDQAMCAACHGHQLSHLQAVTVGEGTRIAVAERRQSDRPGLGAMPGS